MVDDHTMLREGLAHLLQLEPDIEVIGEAEDGEQAVETARRLRPGTHSRACRISLTVIGAGTTFLFREYWNPETVGVHSRMR